MDGVRRAVEEHAERGVDVIKVMASGGMLTAGTDVVRDPVHGRRAARRRGGRPRGRSAGAGPRPLARRHPARGRRPASTGSSTSPASPRTACWLPDDLLDGRSPRPGSQVCPTMGGDPARLPPPDRMPPGAAGGVRAARAWTSRRSWRPRVGHRGRMREHGVTVVTGTDAGISPPKGHGWSGSRSTTWSRPATRSAEALGDRDLGRRRRRAGCPTSPARSGRAWPPTCWSSTGTWRLDVEALGRPVGGAGARRTERDLVAGIPASSAILASPGTDGGLEAVDGGGQRGVALPVREGRAWG